MSTLTQYNPQQDLNDLLLAEGASKTVYALVTPETEAAKCAILGNALSPQSIDRARAVYLEQFRDAWTGKQEKIHNDFFDTWHAWSAPLVDLDRAQFPHIYPTAGASEPLRHLIADYGNVARVENFTPRVHVFKGEYEGYKAYAEASKIEIVEHDRHDWQTVAATLPENEWFFFSQPSAIDGNVWPHANQFTKAISERSNQPRVIVDLTYVGAIPEQPSAKFDVNAACVRNVVFSLSKPFGVYYDRIGGVFSRDQDAGLLATNGLKIAGIPTGHQH